MTAVERTLVVWCPDWPVAASKLPASQPIAVLEGGRIVSTSPAARRDGVYAGLLRREAQARCPDLIVLDREPAVEVRTFEPVIVTIEAIAPRVEVIEPGRCAIATRGPSCYFGGDEALVKHVTMLADEATRNAEIEVKVCAGIADGVFAAGLAARASLVVPPRESPSFLAPQPIEALGHRELVDLLRRLGIRTLGDFAALPAADVLGRFGEDGAIAHRHAQGIDSEPFHPRTPAVELSVTAELDPPVQRVDTAAFAARALAEQLHDRLGREGLACNRLIIEASTEHGESLTRIWRHDGRLTAAAIAERLRWQLDSWLTNDDEDTTAGLTMLRLTPEGLLPDNGRQLGFWGGSLDANERTERALARVQGLLGEESVVTAVIGGGRSPADQVRLVPWGNAREQNKPGYPEGFPRADPLAPAPMKKKRARAPEVPSWPGRLPEPAPATVYAEWPPAELMDSSGNTVTVNSRGAISAPPAQLTIGNGARQAVTGWTGPWLIDERWWDVSAHRRRARLQVVVESGDALLVALEMQKWWVEARYD